MLSIKVFAKQIEEIIGNNQIDIVHAFSSYYGFLASFLNLSIPLIFTPFASSIIRHAPNNFIPIVYLQKGGIISFIGYCIIVCFSFYDALRILRQKKIIEIEDYVVAISLIIMIPFLFQRTTIWETPLFALLYFPSLLKIELE